MAELPQASIRFDEGCPDCGVRLIELPQALPEVGDDFDWQVRDYDGFRLFMLEELAARFPDRQRWTPADIEVVIVEVLAALLDQYSDMLDRVSVEAVLESARRPESVYRLLGLVGFDAVADAQARAQIPFTLVGTDAIRALLAFWNDNPHLMDQARAAGPRSIHQQKRMVTLDDYAVELEKHPLVMRAYAWKEWQGAWFTVRVGVINWGHTELDTVPEVKGQTGGYPAELAAEIRDFHIRNGLYVPDDLLDTESPPTIRSILRHYIEGYRMVGQAVLLEDAIPAPIYISFSIRVSDNYAQSEIRRAVDSALGVAPGGFFEPGRLRFGEDLHASDLVHLLMSIHGVEQVCLNRFKRLGAREPDRVADGHIPLDGLEIAICDNDMRNPDRGYFRLTLAGGMKG